MANIAERKAALHSESLEVVESLDGGIADEVAELRSLIESQLAQVQTSFTQLADTKASADRLRSEAKLGHDPSFQLPWNSVTAEIEECKGPRAVSLDNFRDEIITHRDQLTQKKAKYQTELEDRRGSLITDQQSLKRAIRALANLYEANSVEQNVTNTKIDQTKYSIKQVTHAWERLLPLRRRLSYKNTSSSNGPLELLQRPRQEETKFSHRANMRMR